VILAQPIDAATPIIAAWGIPGVLLVVLASVIVVLYRQNALNARHDREAREKAEERERQSHADLVDKVMPALAKNQEVLSAAIEAMRDARRGHQ
jgi:cytochrome c-type biogenesis protein CcmH/NrfF